jgi:tetratricopeptide (TPR) repeat protein
MATLKRIGYLLIHTVFVLAVYFYMPFLPPALAVQLETIRGGRHSEYASIVFEVNEPVQSTPLQILGEKIQFRFIGTTTTLKSYRRYQTFDAWVKVEKSEKDLSVQIGLPDRFQKMSHFRLTNPDRVVLNLYIAAETVSLKPEGSTKKTEPAPLSIVPTDSPPPPETDPKPMRYVGDQRQMHLIEARILSRKGLYEDSLRAYERLRRDYPGDDDIWEDFIETLVNHSGYERAEAELKKLLKKNPANVRARRIQARTYTERRRSQLSLPVFETLVSQVPKDAGILSDYGFAQQDTGDWSAALDYFSQVLELDPENTAALRSVHEILKNHRPRLDVAYQANYQESGNAEVKTAFGRYAQHISKKSLLVVNYDRIDIDRPSAPDLLPIDSTVNDTVISLQYRLNPQWGARIGGGGYSGLGDGTSFVFGLDYSPRSGLAMMGDYVHKRPWYDPVDAALFEGSYNRATASMNWNIDQSWTLFLGGGYWDYQVEDDQDYGKKKTFTGILSKRFWDQPNLTFIYSYYYSDFDYEDDTFRPIAMIPTEGVHSIGAYFEHRTCKNWTYTLFGGRRWDVVRSVDSWYFLPSLKVRLGNRIEVGVNYEYLTEASTAGGGITETLLFWSKIIF